MIAYIFSFIRQALDLFAPQDVEAVVCREFVNDERQKPDPIK